ncbi:UNVERIFIED_CONTAM: hypothetical protein FKN15_005079 [Acipenser sinensis]
MGAVDILLSKIYREELMSVTFKQEDLTAAKAAAILATDNHIIDWAQPDLDLVNRIFSQCLRGLRFYQPLNLSLPESCHSLNLL